MRDEERISMYYIFGTLDRNSEKAPAPAEKKAAGIAFRAVRIIKMSALLWAAALKNMSHDKRK